MLQTFNILSEIANLYFLSLIWPLSVPFSVIVDDDVGGQGHHFRHPSQLPAKKTPAFQMSCVSAKKSSLDKSSYLI